MRYYLFMFCKKCGAQNSDEAVFCQKCGTRLEDEEQTRIANRPRNFSEENDDDEQEIFSIRPTLMFVKVGYGLAVLGAFLLVFLFAIFSSLLSSPISALIVVLLGLSLLLIPAYFHLKQKLVRYTLTDSKMEIDTGFISHHTRNVPLRIIQDVSVSASIPQRMLGFGNLIIENANESDEPIVLKNINSPRKYADILLKQMRLLNR